MQVAMTMQAQLSVGLHEAYTLRSVEAGAIDSNEVVMSALQASTRGRNQTCKHANLPVNNSALCTSIGEEYDGMFT